MADDLREVTEWFPLDSWPVLRCPHCRKGTLRASKVSQIESAESARRSRFPDSNPLDIEGVLNGTLTCSSQPCRGIVAVVGEFSTDVVTSDDGFSWEYQAIGRLRFAIPALVLFNLPDRTPKRVAEAVREAERVILADPAAAGNRLRIATEILMTEKRIPKTLVDKNGHRQVRKLHSRIVMFQKRYPEVGDVLLAVKWIGNSGSHEGAVGLPEVLDACEIFQHALDLLYGDKSKALTKKIKKINDSRGVPRTRVARSS